MASLCEQLLGCESRVVQDEERENAIMEAVRCGCPVLVPYPFEQNMGKRLLVAVVGVNISLAEG